MVRITACGCLPSLCGKHFGSGFKSFSWPLVLDAGLGLRPQSSTMLIGQVPATLKGCISVCGHSCDIADWHTQMHCVMPQSPGSGRDQASTESGSLEETQQNLHLSCLQNCHSQNLSPSSCSLPPAFLNQVFVKKETSQRL